MFSPFSFYLGYFASCNFIPGQKGLSYFGRHQIRKKQRAPCFRLRVIALFEGISKALIYTWEIPTDWPTLEKTPLNGSPAGLINTLKFIIRMFMIFKQSSWLFSCFIVLKKLRIVLVLVPFRDLSPTRKILLKSSWEKFKAKLSSCKKILMESGDKQPFNWKVKQETILENKFPDFIPTQPAFICIKLTIETQVWACNYRLSSN